MVHHRQAWGVQVGPKVDQDGTHVAVYAWKNCAPPCEWEFFKEWDELTPGSEHLYAIVWGQGGWALMFDGRVLTTINVGGPDGAIYEQGTESTRN